VPAKCQHLGASRSPVAGQPDGTFAEAGRGLGLVELLANRWGHIGDQTGRPVFFELRWEQHPADTRLSPVGSRLALARPAIQPRRR